MHPLRLHPLSLALLSTVLYATGCSNSGLAPPSGAGGDLGTPSDASSILDGGTVLPDGGGEKSDAGFVPAAHPPLPQIPFNGGALLDSPAIVTITYKGDPLEPAFQTFDKWLPQSKYFTQALGEYNIKAGMQESVYSNPRTPPPTLDDSEIQLQLKAQIENGTLPPVTPDRLYTIYLPDGVTVTNTFGGTYPYKSCVDMLAYHSVGPTVKGGAIVYVVSPRCHGMGITDLDYATWSASAEIAKAATNPTNTGWYIAGMPEGAPFGGDVASLCNNFGGPIEGHFVSSIYSNAAAKADQRPCLPAPAGPMFGAPAKPDTIQLKPGDSASTMATVYTTAPLGKPLKLAVYGYPMADVTVKASSALVQNGDVVKVDVTLSPNTKSGSNPVVVIQCSSGDYHWENYVVIYVP